MEYLFNNLINFKMKKRILKTLLMLVFAPLSLIVCAVYTVGSMLKTVSYLSLGAVEDAEKEIATAFKYE